MTSIEILHGRTTDVCIELTQANGEPYVMAEGEILRFGVKRSPTLQACCLQKTATAADYSAAAGGYLITLCPEDTMSMQPGLYYYDVGLQSGADYLTVVDTSRLILSPVVTHKEVVENG